MLQQAWKSLREERIIRLASVPDVPEKQLGDRRAAMAREVAAQVSGAVSAQAACMLAAEALRARPREISFALFYLIDNAAQQAFLAGVAGIDAGEPRSPFAIALDGDPSMQSWPLTEALQSGTVIMQMTSSHSAAVVPIRSPRTQHLYGCAVFGLNPSMPLEKSGAEFLELVAGNLATAIEHLEGERTPKIEAPPASLSQTDRKGSEDPRVVLLLVEDNRADVFLVERAIEFHRIPVQIVVAQDGEEAIQYLERASADPNIACPGVLLVDLNLPKRSGIEILERVRQLPRCNETPVIIVTSSDSQSDREKATQLGATRYFRKPSSYQEFLDLGEVLKEVLEKSKQ